jgi:ATP-dependent RNA helicase RhlE
MQKKLSKAGIEELFPVQTSTFHLFAEQENELIVKSKTGTGKTLSFLLPLEYLLKYKSTEGSETKRKDRKVRAIILEPTRELATQVQTQVEKFTSLDSCLLYGGGESKQTQCKYFVSH